MTFWEYVRAAFHDRVNLPGLGKMPLNKMGLGLFGVLGLANPGFWLLGAALEISYLVLRGGSARFQKLVEGQRLLEEHRTWRERLDRAVQKLTPESLERYRRLLEQSQRILGITDSLEAADLTNLRDLRNRSLNQLLVIFIRLLTTREMIVANVQGVEKSQIEKEMSELDSRLEEAEGGSPLYRSLEGTREILRRRAENLDRADTSIRVIDAELDRIEKQVELIREEAAVGAKPELLSSRLDTVTSTMQETAQWMEQHSEFFQSLSGDDLGEVMSALPEMPMEKEQ